MFLSCLPLLWRPEPAYPPQAWAWHREAQALRARLDESAVEVRALREEKESEAREQGSRGDPDSENFCKLGCMLV